MTTATAEAPPTLDTATDIRQIPLAAIDRSRNHRISQPGDDAKIQALMVSIMAAGGLLQPVRVYEIEAPLPPKNKHEYILGFGARRCAALERLGETHVTAVVFPPASNAEIEAARAIENLHRQDISPMEEVLAVSNMLDALMDEDNGKEGIYEVAAGRLGRSVRWVRDRDYLHRLSAKCQELALRADVPAGHLREIAKVGDPQLQFSLVCDAAGISSWCFVTQGKGADKLTIKSSDQKRVAEFFEQVAQGAVKGRATLREIEHRVAEAQQSLRAAPWKFELPVIIGKRTIRACAGCPHNSETDRTLFGIVEDVANPRGVCLNPSCYRDKVDAVEKTKTKLAKSFARAKEVPAAEKIDAKTPDWLKQTTARGYVKREVKKRLDGAGGKAPTAKLESSGRHGERKLTDHEKALLGFEKAFTNWADDAAEKIEKEIPKHPPSLSAYCVLRKTGLWLSSENWDVPRPYTYSSKPETKSPKPPANVDPALIDLVQMVATPTLGVFGHLGRAVSMDDLEQDWRGGIEDRHPAVIDALARSLKIELKPAPTWDQFDPAKQEAKPTSKPAKSSKAKPSGGKKKAAKKKRVSKTKGNKHDQ